MNKENSDAKADKPTGRITRARARALSTVGGKVHPSKCSIVGQKCELRGNSKRAASDVSKLAGISTACLQHKKRAVLKDVTNICSEDSYMKCIGASKVQTTKQVLRGPANMVPNISVKSSRVHDDAKEKLAEDLSKIKVVESQEFKIEAKSETGSLCESIGRSGVAVFMHPMPAKPQFPKHRDEDMVCEKLGISEDPGIVNIDKNSEDTQACCLYAPEIYNRIRLTELDHRASTNYMEKLQIDITASMRGILVDWLVEVSEEYKLVPDTLYLTVNLTDRFLSKNHIGKQRLQLLGVTCMLIASKYEEICAPRVEEFCFITDSTYTKTEVLEMESRILNLLHCQLSVPTTKTFLRRYVQAAQVTYKVPCEELEFLANYLAELTLVEYSFLEFLPSLIAASAVFLARWTLNQSNHPWNPTLQHYTSYKASELKTTVLALEDLQLNTNCSSLIAVRQKYRQEKFKCVAVFTSSQSALSIFSEDHS